MRRPSRSFIAPTPGGFGGSLGYANRTGINGFAAGWIGVAFDEFVHHASSICARDSGVDATVPSSITTPTLPDDETVSIQT